jgi:hypothetical protein
MSARSAKETRLSRGRCKKKWRELTPELDTFEPKGKGFFFQGQ